jgi:hypothetical protein
VAAPALLELSTEEAPHDVIRFDEVSQVVEIQLQLKVRFPALCLFRERLLLLLLLLPLLPFVLICIRSFTTAPRAKAAPFISTTSGRAT